MTIVRQLLAAAVLASATLLPAGAFAQQAGQAPPAGTAPGYYGQGHHRNGMMHMLRRLNLSDQQQTKIRQIVQQYRQAHPRGSQPDPQAERQLHEQIMAVLTPQQRDQLRTEMQQARQQHSNPMSTAHP